LNLQRHCAYFQLHDFSWKHTPHKAPITCAAPITIPSLQFPGDSYADTQSTVNSPVDLTMLALGVNASDPAMKKSVAKDVNFMLTIGEIREDK
jgi:hypothetical protein